MRHAGEVVELSFRLDRAHRGHEYDRGQGPGRGAVREFSPKSRRRLAKVCASVSWGTMPFLFLTLTYPGEFPHDGPTCSAHLTAFRKRWERRYGAPVAVWKREYQRRGAVHFHLAILEPAGVPMVEVQRWVSRSWYEIVGSGDPRHLSAGTNVEAMRRPPTAYFACHGAHGRDEKGYQNEVPEGFGEPGRFWGLWNLAPMWDEQHLTPAEFIQARRMLRAWARSKRFRQRAAGGRVQGFWLRTANRPALGLAGDIRRALAICQT